MRNASNHRNVSFLDISKKWVKFKKPLQTNYRISVQLPLPLEELFAMIGAVLLLKKSVYRKKHHYKISTSFATLRMQNNIL